MPVTKIDQPSHLIIDNSVLSMLTECWCSENVGKPARELLDLVHNWVLENLSKLKATAIESQLHITDLVSNEYKPENGQLGARGLQAGIIRSMAQDVRLQFHVTPANVKNISALRTLPGASKRLVNPSGGLSDSDLSLIQLGIEMTQLGYPVIILSNDQDLLDFAAWIKTQKALRVDGHDPAYLEAETGLGYLELIHRSCLIPSDLMTLMINYVINTTMYRLQQTAGSHPLNTQKAMRIIQKATSVNALFARAIEIKAQNRSMVQ